MGGVAASMDNFLIWYFQHDMRLSIYAQLDKKNHDLNNEEVVIKQVLDVKAKAA